MVVLGIAVWVGAAELVNGAPRAIVYYYFGDFNASTPGEIIHSEVRCGRACHHDITDAYSVGNKRYTSSVINFSANTSRAHETVSSAPRWREPEKNSDPLIHATPGVNHRISVIAFQQRISA